MPKSTRDLLKRKVGHAYHNAHLGADHISAVREVFAEAHPDLADILTTVMDCFDAASLLLGRFWQEAWKSDIVAYQRWRNTGKQSSDPTQE